MIATPFTPAANAFRVIDTGDRVAIHRVAIDDAGTITAFDPEPVTLAMARGDGQTALWALAGEAMAAARAMAAPMLRHRDGELAEDDAPPLAIAA